MVSNQTCTISHQMNRACDKRLARLTSYILHTCQLKQYCHVGNTAQRCRLGMFQDSDFAGYLEDSKSTSRRILCIFRSRTFFQTSWMCQTQTSASHSSTESEIISSDAGLRMDGIPAVDLLDVVIEVSHSSKNTHQAVGDRCRKGKVQKQVQGDLVCGDIRSTNSKIKLTRSGDRDVDELSNVDYVVTNANSSQGEFQLYIFEDNEAVIEMIIKGRSPTMRHVYIYIQNTQSCVRLVFGQNQFGPENPNQISRQQDQLAEMLTKGSRRRPQRRTEAVMRIDQRKQMDGGIPKRWKQPKGEDRTKMKKEARRLRCTLLSGSAWSTEKILRRYTGKCDIFFGLEH